MIVLLAAVYGVLQVSFVDQALFNVGFLDDTQFAENAAGARRTWVPGLEFSAAQLLSYVGNHIVLTIGAPIAIVETVVSPERRHRPWLRWPGLLVVSALFVLGCWIVYADTSDGFAATGLQRSVAAAVVVGLIAVALLVAHRSGLRVTTHRLRSASRGDATRNVPRPLWIVLVVIGARLTDDQVPGWWGVALMVTASAVAGGLILWWSRRPGWNQAHVLAAASTSLALAAALSWVVPTYEPSSTTAAVTGDLAVTAVALLLVGGAWWRLSARGRIA
jgi:hypothetical protein